MVIAMGPGHPPPPPPTQFAVNELHRALTSTPSNTFRGELEPKLQPVSVAEPHFLTETRRVEVV